MANSYKEGGRCVAGIDLDTGQWIRPVSGEPGGKLPTHKVSDLHVLDVVEISLADDADDEGCQPENHLWDRIEWKKIRRLKPEEVLQYCEDDTVILHNREKYVNVDYFDSIAPHQWKSLQLVHIRNVVFDFEVWPEGKKWEACFFDGDGNKLWLRITDPEFLQKLKVQGGARRDCDCILTISLATPWQKDTKTSPRCYKVVAGVIEL